MIAVNLSDETRVKNTFFGVAGNLQEDLRFFCQHCVRPKFKVAIRHWGAS
jgi:hypothetical protein